MKKQNRKPKDEYPHNVSRLINEESRDGFSNKNSCEITRSTPNISPTTATRNRSEAQVGRSSFQPSDSPSQRKGRHTIVNILEYPTNLTSYMSQQVQQVGQHFLHKNICAFERQNILGSNWGAPCAQSRSGNDVMKQDCMLSRNEFEEATLQLQHSTWMKSPPKSVLLLPEQKLEPANFQSPRVRSLSRNLCGVRDIDSVNNRSSFTRDQEAQLSHSQDGGEDLDRHSLSSSQSSTKQAETKNHTPSLYSAQENRLSINYLLCDKPFPCDQCPSSFTRKRDLRRHVSSIHNERLYICKFCGHDFMQKLHLNVHIRTVHLRAKPYECEVCEKSFTSNSYAMRHKRQAHPELFANKRSDE